MRNAKTICFAMYSRGRFGSAPLPALYQTFVTARKQENLYAWVTYLQILTLEYAAGDYLPNGNGKKELNSGVKLE